MAIKRVVFGLILLHTKISQLLEDRFLFNIPPGFMDCVCASKDVECDQLFFAQPHTLGHPHGHPQHHILLHLHERQVENLHLQHPLII